jgi:hypothetical protein
MPENRFCNSLPHGKIRFSLPNGRIGKNHIPASDSVRTFAAGTLNSVYGSINSRGPMKYLHTMIRVANLDPSLVFLSTSSALWSNAGM